MNKKFIIGAVVVGAVAYFLFMRNKKKTSDTATATASMPQTKPLRVDSPASIS